jgi:ABC-type dipeptide/oligopeptide/nickel transport system permease component
MGVFLVRRLTLLPFQAVGVVTIVFVLVHLLPGNPAYLIAGPQATASQVRAISAELGLTHPLPVQYVDYMGNVAHGNLGVSRYTSNPVITARATATPCACRHAGPYAGRCVSYLAERHCAHGSMGGR